MSADTVTPLKPKSSSGAKDRRAKFVGLASSRTINAIKAIRVIGKLGNKAHYEYTEADVNKIARALQKEIDALKARMTSKGSRDTVEFEL